MSDLYQISLTDVDYQRLNVIRGDQANRLNGSVIDPYFDIEFLLGLLGADVKRKLDDIIRTEDDAAIAGGE